MALSQKYDTQFCSCCKCFTFSLLSYWLGYATSLYFVGEVVTLLGAITEKNRCENLSVVMEHKQCPGKGCSEKIKR